MCRRRQNGFSLMELMTALALTMIVLAAINKMFFNTRLVSHTEDEVAALSDNARYLINQISHDVRMAGYVGCTHLSPDNYTSTINNYQGYLHNFDISIEGFDPTNINSMPTALTNDLTNFPVQAGTDVLVVRRASNVGYRMLYPKTDSSLTIEYASSQANNCPNGGGDQINGMCPGDVVVLSDCEKAKSFIISSISTITNASGDTEVLVTHSGSANDPAQWGGPDSEIATDKFNPQSSILSLVSTTAYYVTSAPDTAAQPYLNDSMRTVADGTNSALIDGVEDMHVLYGVDTDGDGSINRYVSANLLSAVPGANLPMNFSNVLSIRIAFMMRSHDPIMTREEVNSYPNATIVFPFLDQNRTINITDGRIHRAFDTTIFLRNGPPP